MKQVSNMFICLGILYCLIKVLDGQPKPKPKAKPKPKLHKNSEIFDYGCPCGERDVTEEEVMYSVFFTEPLRNILDRKLSWNALLEHRFDEWVR